MDFQDFKNKLKNLNEGIEKLKQNEKVNYGKDERFWYPTLDKAGNSYALIRFLPQKNPSDEPIIEIKQHSFQINGRWIIETCPKTENYQNPCPLCEYSNKLYDEENDFARQVWHKKQKIVNIYVKNDKNNPENNGKVFLYKMPVSIYNAVMAKVAPEIPEDEPIMVFDFFDGMDFKLKVRQKGGFNNYDLSEFTGKITPIVETEDEMKKIYEQIYDLNAYKKEMINSVKSYEELQKILKSALGASSKEKLEKESKPTMNESKEDEDIADEDFSDIDDIDDIEF